MSYVITRPGGGYLALHGWQRSPHVALQFRSKDDALEHAQREKEIGAMAERYTPPPAPGMTAYNPFSTGPQPRG